MKKFGSKYYRLIVLVILVALAASAGAGLYQNSNGHSADPLGVARQSFAGNQPYAVEPGEAIGEGDILSSMESYWNTRISYPTGRYEHAWVQEAAVQDAQVQVKLPAGQVTYRKPDGAEYINLDPTQFTALGPAPLQSDGCQSCYNYGHVSGRINAIAIDPVTPSVAYIAAVGGGVWKSTNCCTTGTTWTPVTDSPLLTTSSIDALEIDPSNHNIVYAGTGDLNFGSFSMGSAGLFKSTDQGATWAVKGADVFGAYYPEPVGAYPQYQAIGKVKVDPRNTNNIVAGTKTGLYISYDGGDNWAGPCLTNNFTTQRQDTTGLYLRNSGSSTTIYAALGTRGFSTTVQSNLAENGANGIYTATLGTSGCPTFGLSSTPSNGWPAGTGSGIPVYQTGGNTLGRIDMAVAPSNPDYIYAEVQAINGNRGGLLGVWRTTDGGVTWTQRSTTSGLTGCAGDYAQNWYDQGLAIDPNNPDIVMMDTFDIWKSSNGGTTFVDKTCGYAGGNTVHVDQHALFYVPGSSTTLLAGNDGGIYVSSDAGENYTQLNDTMNTIEFYSGDITGNFAVSANPGANGGAQDNGSSVYQWSGNPGPALWQLKVGGDGFYARIEPVLNLRWYQENNNGSVYVSQTGPNGTYANITGGWTADTRSFTTPYEIYKNDCPPTGCTHMILGSNRVWESITGGIPSNSWHSNSPNLTKQTLADRSYINQLSYSVSMSTTAIAGTNDGNVQYGFNLGQATANSATWVNVTGGNATLPNRPILDVATDALNPLVGYAAIGGFDQNTPSTPGHVYRVTCATDCATFTWENKSGNLPNIPVDSIITNPNYPQQVFAGSDWGLYYTDDINAASPTWYRFNAGLPNVMIWDMQLDRGFTTLSLWTRNRGAYVWPLPSGPIGGATPTPGAPTATPQPTATSILPTITPPLPTLTPGATETGTPQATMTAQPSVTVEPSVTPTDCPIPFVDINGNVFYTAIKFLYCRGVVNGTDATHYSPAGTASRAQFAKVVVLGFAIPSYTPSGGGQDFTDVPPSYFAYQYIEAGFHAGILSGFDTQSCITAGAVPPCYLPNRPITRAQLTKLVVSAGGFMMYTPTSGQTFTDVGPNNVFYAFIETAAHYGIINGYPDNTFRPNNNIRRDEMAQIVYKGIITAP